MVYNEMKHQDDLEEIVLQLKNLNNGVRNLSLIAEQLKMPEEMISSFEIISYAIMGIKRNVDERIKELIEKQEM